MRHFLVSPHTHTGVPRPLVYWFRNGKPLRPTQHTEMAYSEDGHYMIRQRHSRPDDSGIYTVFAINSAGRDVTSAKLLVDRSTVDETSFISAETHAKLARRFV